MANSPEKTRPATKTEAMTVWSVQAFTLTARIQRANDNVKEGIRRVIAEQRMRGQVEKRLIRAVEELEDSVDALAIILLGPEPSQEELDAP